MDYNSYLAVIFSYSDGKENIITFNCKKNFQISIIFISDHKMLLTPWNAFLKISKISNLEKLT